jgi:hypothetical protein
VLKLKKNNSGAKRLIETRMKWVGHVLTIREVINAYEIVVGQPEGKNHLEDLGVKGSV